MNTVFASRWKALVWSAGILMTAYCSVPSRDETAEADAATQARSEQHAHRNPWALDKK